MIFSSYLKNEIKKNKLALAIYEFFFQRQIINYFKGKHKKRLLFSYSTYHFNKKNYNAHSNYQESLVIAKIFDDMGYQVDVVNNNKDINIDISSYDIIFGEGIPLYQALSADSKVKKIYYGTGSHPFHCSGQSYNRLIDFYKKHSFLASSSIRVNDSRWGIAASLADAVICIGNETTKKTFELFGASNVYCIDPTFHLRGDALDIGLAKEFSLSKKSILWFGSYGLLHKGLDIIIDAVRNMPEWTLHVCGYTPAEKQFLEALDVPQNVIIHGFVNIQSEKFKEIANQCGFVILPSCSEGTATAIITAVGNGAMIPIVTNECGYDVDGNGFTVQLSVSDIQHKLDEIVGYDPILLKEISIKSQQQVIERYTLDNFKDKMAALINELVNKELK
ncbi:glycosyltransferase [Aeromonas veronii]